MANLKRGLLIVLSGPSGVGKGTIRIEAMKDKSLNLFYSISLTTRAMRTGEVNGKDYYFVSKDEFIANIKRDNLLEYAEFVGNYYGTPKDKVDAKRNEGINVLLEIEVNGTKQVLDRVDKKGLVTIFILPPSFEELRRRLKARGTDSDEVIERRVNKAKEEVKMKKYYDYVITNYDYRLAAKEIANIIKSEAKKLEDENN